MVLILVLVAAFVLSVLGITFLGVAYNEHQLSRSQRDGLQAVYLADLGIERAKSLLNQRLDADPNKQDFDFELTDNNGYLYGSAAAHDAFTVGAYQAGEYRVLVTNNTDGGGAGDDRDLTVWATAEGRVTLRGHTRTKRVEALLGPTPITFGAFAMGCNPGSGDTLDISGNPTIAGSMGSVHSNCNVSISGDPNIAENLTASDAITIGGSPTIGGATSSGVPPMPIAEVNPADFKPLADYIMVEDAGAGTAKIYDALGNLVFDATGGGVWPGPGGWQFSGTPGDFGKWQYVNDDVPAQLQDRTFYVEKAAGNPPGQSGNVIIGSSPGDPGSEWQVSIVAEGHIDISGNPMMRADSDGLLLVAGTDIKVGGNYTAPWPGGIIIAAHEQIAFSGNPEFVGFVLAENAATDDNAVLNTFMSGNPTITYDGAPPPPAAWGFSSIRVRAWRELS
ncbi:MAG: hypothetical protein ACE5K9_05370 [Candidatus Methylomirabilales bacterium]